MKLRLNEILKGIKNRLKNEKKIVLYKKEKTTKIVKYDKFKN